MLVAAQAAVASLVDEQQFDEMKKLPGGWNYNRSRSSCTLGKSFLSIR
jgi:hypothetical protein